MTSPLLKLGLGDVERHGRDALQRDALPSEPRFEAFTARSKALDGFVKKTSYRGRPIIH